MKKIFILSPVFVLLLSTNLEALAQYVPSNAPDRVDVIGHRQDPDLTVNRNALYNAPEYGGFSSAPLTNHPFTFSIPPAIGSAAPSAQCNAANPISKNPVVLATGTKYVFQQDFPHASMLGMPLSRTYRSEEGGFQFFGTHWTSSLQYAELSLYGGQQPTYLNGSQTPTQLPAYIDFRLPDGGVYQFSHFITSNQVSSIYFTPATLNKIQTGAPLYNLT